MQASKTRLTKLKNKLDEKLPDENDLYGFEGISKDMILTVIDDSYKILSALDNFKNSFEAILLKRNTISTTETNYSENKEALILY